MTLETIRKEIKKIAIHLAFRGRLITEGSTSPEELNYFVELAKRSNARLIGEIGFNAGFSSLAFLSADPEIKVISFDIGEHRYSQLAKKYIDTKFPNRHTLILGDSTKTVPQFAQEHKGFYFDLVFIDGGHDYKVAKTDILNMKQLCTEKTVVVIDDLTPWFPWGQGPYKAWKEALSDNLVIQKELFKDGKPISKIEPPGERIWAMGHYR